MRFSNRELIGIAFEIAKEMGLSGDRMQWAAMNGQYDNRNRILRAQDEGKELKSFLDSYSASVRAACADEAGYSAAIGAGYAKPCQRTHEPLPSYDEAMADYHDDIHYAPTESERRLVEECLPEAGIDFDE